MYHLTSSQMLCTLIRSNADGIAATGIYQHYCNATFETSVSFIYSAFLSFSPSEEESVMNLHVQRILAPLKFPTFFRMDIVFLIIFMVTAV